jgi:Mn-dependent DtxR family transcriptional regulator
MLLKRRRNMDKLFLDSKEVARLLNVSQQQAYKIIREMNKKLAEEGFLILRGKINTKYFMEQIYKAEEGSNASI